MKITLNGKLVDTNSTTIGDLLQEKQIPQGKIAVEMNGHVIPKSLLDNSPIQENAVIEIITFVGGG